jgi:hypothetical protein
MAAAQQLIDKHPKLQEVRRLIMSSECHQSSPAPAPPVPALHGRSSAAGVNSARESVGDVFTASDRPSRSRSSRGRRRRGAAVARHLQGGMMMGDAAGFAMQGPSSIGLMKRTDVPYLGLH